MTTVQRIAALQHCDGDAELLLTNKGVAYVSQRCVTLWKICVLSRCPEVLTLQG
jgi:hypothetical protein